MNDLVYADFTCPACYLANLRVDRPLAACQPVPDWHAVEHRPRLAYTGLRLDAVARTTRDRGLDELRPLLAPDEDLPPNAPNHLPHTAYAEAYCAGLADPVRALLLRAYWRDNLGIGDPEALRRLLPDAFRQGRCTSDAVRDFGYAVTSQHAPITHAAYSRARQWQQHWLALGGRDTQGDPGR